MKQYHIIFQYFIIGYVGDLISKTVIIRKWENENELDVIYWLNVGYCFDWVEYFIKKYILILYKITIRN